MTEHTKTGAAWEPSKETVSIALKTFDKTGGLDRSEYMRVALIAAVQADPMLSAAAEMRDALIHIEEYWNGSETNGAMADALHEIGATARAALAKSRGDN
jgi:hypothetical protein